MNTLQIIQLITPAVLTLWIFVLTIRSNNLHSRVTSLELSKGVAQEYIVRDSHLVEPQGHRGQTGLGAFPTRKAVE